MRKLLRILAVGILPLSVLIPSANAESTCFEDQPCWNCETMGNGICGLTPSENAAELSESTLYNGTTELPKTS